MPRPIIASVRQAIVEQHSAGRTFTQIAQEFGLSSSGVRKIWKLWRGQPQRGLKPDYGRCGHARQRFEPYVVQEAQELKRSHPKWGAGYIRAQLHQKWPQLKLPHVGTLWLWFRNNHLIVHNSRLPAQSSTEWAHQVHQCWQVDAKERVHLADDSWVCWLDVTDEYSGAGLATEVFPPKALERGGSPWGSAVAARPVCPVGASRQAAL